MPAKRILLLDGPFLTAYHWHAGHIKVEGEFSHEGKGLEAFAAYLERYRSSLFFLLADIAEEGFQLEDLPYVQGADRAALLQRRLGQYYYNTSLSTAISLGRAKDGRRDEKLLFAALTRIETFTPWLDTLRATESMLAGVYSVPLVLAECAAQLTVGNGPTLFVSLTRGGVRQTFFDAGKLHFSRLSQLASQSLDEVGRTSAADSVKIFQYLLTQRQIPRGTALRTLVLAHAAQIPALQDFYRNTDELEFEFVDIAAAAARLALKDVPEDSNADKLFIHSLAVKTPQQQFAAPGERRFYKLWQIRFALTSAAWIMLAGCLLVVGKTAVNVHQLDAAVETTHALTATDTQRYNSILAGLPSVNITPAKLRALMARYDALQKRGPALEPLLLHLSQALSDTPRIELVRLSWKSGERLDVLPKAADDAKRVNGAAPPAPAAADSWSIVEIQAQLPLGLARDKRAQNELIESFAARLREPQTDVTILSRPFAMESDKALRSNDEKGEAQLADVPKFTLRIARPL